MGMGFGQAPRRSAGGAEAGSSAWGANIHGKWCWADRTSEVGSAGPSANGQALHGFVSTEGKWGFGRRQLWSGSSAGGAKSASLARISTGTRQTQMACTTIARHALLLMHLPVGSAWHLWSSARCPARSASVARLPSRLPISIRTSSCRTACTRTARCEHPRLTTWGSHASTTVPDSLKRTV
jgi:hypothetical protein